MILLKQKLNYQKKMLDLIILSVLKEAESNIL